MKTQTWRLSCSICMDSNKYLSHGKIFIYINVCTENFKTSFTVRFKSDDNAKCSILN